LELKKARSANNRSPAAIKRLALALLLCTGASVLAGDSDQSTPQARAELSPTAQPTVLVPSPAYQSDIAAEPGSLVREEVAKADQEHADREDWNTPAFWVNVFLALVGAVYSAFACLQWVAIGRQADIAQGLLNLERPWIALDDVVVNEVGPDPDGHCVVEIFFNVLNSGRSPAAIVSQILASRLQPKGKELSTEPSFPPQEPRFSILPVSGKNHAVHKFRVSEIQVSDFFAGNLTLIFFGQIPYRAASDKETDPLHECRWCFFYERPYKYRVLGAERPGYTYYAGPPSWNKST
jgi:hypothetical protein